MSVSSDDENSTRAIERLEKEPPGSDVLRILVATDNHLGLNENDPVRGEDSFRTMDEIFKIGRKCHADMVILGGDLFHINKPTRSTTIKTQELFRKHTRGRRPVDLIVRGQQFGRDGKTPVNFEDENSAVDMPIFMIHGNHDNPTHDGCNVVALSPLDILQADGLVNYFGRVQKMDDAVLEPVLIEKGNAKLRLYGMGWIRDERMHQMFHNNCVSFKRHIPHGTEEGYSSRESQQHNEDEVGQNIHDKDWLNVFLVHQNRDYKGRGAKNCFNDEMIPSFMNLVFFGHEHECLIEPQQSIRHPETFLSQPGSSVATSLIEAEAQPKSVGILEVKTDHTGTASFELTPIRLRTVRPFVFDEVVLEEFPELSKNVMEADKIEAISMLLAAKIDEMIRTGREEYHRLNPNATSREVRETLPLIRLRVEHTHFPVLNLQRFGEKFKGKAANPNDLVYFYKRRKVREKTQKNEGSGELNDEDLELPDDEISAGTRINALLENILSGDNKLTFIPDRELHYNIQEFVDKGETKLLEHYLNDVLKSHQEQVLRGRRKKSKKTDEDQGKDGNDDHDNNEDYSSDDDGDNDVMPDGNHITEVIRRDTERRNREASVNLSRSLQSFQDTTDGATDKTTKKRSVTSRNGTGSKSKSTSRPKSNRDRDNDSTASMDDDSEYNDDNESISKALSGKAKRKTASRAASKRNSKLEDDAIVLDSDNDDGDSDDIRSSAARKPAQKYRQQKLTLEKANTKKASSRGGKQQVISESSDDENASFSTSRQNPSSKTTSRTPSRQRAAKKRIAYKESDDESDDESDYSAPKKAPSKRPKRK